MNNISSLRKPLSIVILSFNRSYDLSQTLSRVHQLVYTECADAEVIIVDNASTDNSVDIALRFPEFRLIKLATNIGIGGFNCGFEAATGEWILVLDDDSYPADGCLAAFLDTVDTVPRDVAAVACKVIHPNKAMAVSTETWPRELISFWGCGAFLRRETVAEIGGYHETIFLYQNELEWAIRARTAGMKTIYDSRFVVYHNASPQNRTNSRAFRYNYRNRLLVAFIYYRTIPLFDYLFLAIPVILGKSLTRYGFEDFCFIVLEPLRHFLQLRRGFRGRSQALQEWLDRPEWRYLELLPPRLSEVPRLLRNGLPIY